ncbi:phospholipase D family protein [candidate division KSB1 bacterium]|nr:phospholipase D family protein [candidate division KSB1 bacterium]
MITVLYSSKSILAKIKEVLGDPSTNDRRVVLVAYLGKSAGAYLPHPKGLHIICSPTPGGTSPTAIRQLIQRGAKVEFSDYLHMKVYWSNRGGCIISSANASSNALGVGNLKEAGVYLPPGEVDIDKLITYESPKPVTRSALERLQRANRLLPPNLQSDPDQYSTKATFDYLSWYHSPYRDSDSWKLGWWEDSELETATSAKEKSRIEYGRTEPKAALNVADGTVRKADWLLCFEIVNRRSVRNFAWMFVDFVVPVKPSERKAYEKDYPFQAIQVFPLHRYPRPPFQITQNFRQTFKKAASAFGLHRIEEQVSLNPPKSMIERIAKIMQKGG